MKRYKLAALCAVVLLGCGESDKEDCANTDQGCVLVDPNVSAPSCVGGTLACDVLSETVCGETDGCAMGALSCGVDSDLPECVSLASAECLTTLHCGYDEVQVACARAVGCNGSVESLCVGESSTCSWSTHCEGTTTVTCDSIVDEQDCRARTACSWL